MIEWDWAAAGVFIAGLVLLWWARATRKESRDE